MPTSPAPLARPERNRYFYGLMMDAVRFQRDQDYFNLKRRLLNRYVSGVGVLCGLSLTFDAGASTLMLSPGIANDAAGRDILVLADTPVNITMLTDAKGKPARPVPAGSTLLISIVYAEHKVDPVAVLVPDCDHPNGCAPSTIAEGFRVVVTVAPSGVVGQKPCVFGSLPAAGAPLQAAIAKRIADYPSLEPDASIPLGLLTLPGGPLDAVSVRQFVYNNTLLFELISCLAESSQAAILAYVSGDNQSASAGTALPNPIVVQLVDSSGNPAVGGLPPALTVTAGGGTLGLVSSPAPGQYESTWSLGSTGVQTVIAQSSLSSLTVTFNANINP